MPEDAVLDIAPDISAPDFADTSAPETPAVETPETPESSPDGLETPEGQAPQTDEEKAATAAQSLFEGNKLNEKVKNYLTELHKADPRTAADIRNGLMQNQAIRAVLPGGVQEAKQLKAFKEEIGGEEGVQELRTNTEEFNSLIEAYNSASPKFIDELINANGESFQKLAPSIIDKFAEMDPGGFGSYVSNVWQNDMLRNKVEMIVDRIGDFLPQDNERSTQAFNALKAYFKRIEDFASKPVNSPIQKKEPDNREVEFQKKEESFTRKQWESEESSKHATLFQSTLSGLVGNRTLTAEQRSTINGWYRLKTDELLKAKKDFNTKTEKYFTSKDQKGYQRYQESIRKEVTPQALKYAVDKVLRPTTGVKPVPAPNQPPKPGTPAPARPDAGYKMLSKAPTHDQLSPRTTPDMIRANKAILSDGTRVQWGR